MERSTYHSILEDINGLRNLQEINKIGQCRVCSKAIMEMVKLNFPQVLVEAREVNLEPDLQHTFLRITIDNKKPFLIDEVGSAKYPPYAGYESEAPEQLQNSRADIINNY
jgi:hypothetical protein